ncbi:hypothetical protein FOA52_001549 [Chlamydomonas sp. UWO 241]|nr:hypothetical protein FOA52_001549 [Chlamydomonas sp. UWO 241]
MLETLASFKEEVDKGRGSSAMRGGQGVSLQQPAPRTTLLFTRNPADLTAEYPPIDEWSSNDASKYVQSVLNRAMMSLIFLAIAVCVALGCVLWRLVRCCGIMCCRRTKWRGHKSTQAVLRATTMHVTKVIGLLICIGTIAAGIYALTLDAGAPTVSNGWAHVEAARVHALKVVDSVQSIMNDVADIRGQAANAVAYLYNIGLSSGSAVATAIADMVSVPLQDLQDAAAKVLEYEGGIKDFRKDLVETLDTVKTDWEAKSLHWWYIVRQCCIGVWASGIGLAALLVIVAAVNWAWGIAIVGTLQLILVIALFAGAAAMCNGLVVLSDGCDSLEAIIVQVVPDTYKGTASYYVSANSDPSPEALNAQLVLAGLVDPDEVRALVRDNINQSYAMINTYLYLVPDEYQDTLQQSVDGVTSAATHMLGALNATLELVALDRVRPIYSSSKQFLCCEVPSLAEQYWLMLTIVGWFVLACVAVAMALLAYLDRRQDNGACCMCDCVLTSRLPPAGKPAPAETASASSSELMDDVYVMAIGPAASMGAGGANADGFVHGSDFLFEIFNSPAAGFCFERVDR